VAVLYAERRHLLPLLLLGTIQVRNERVAEFEELFGDRFVVVEVERPSLEGEEQCGALAACELDWFACADGFEACSEPRGGLDVLESAHQRLAANPAQDDVAAV
jgi:hypothetical protein